MSNTDTNNPLPAGYRVLLIVPAFNESLNIPHVLSEIKDACPGFDVIVVDDGSRDNTWETAIECGVDAIRLPVNLGIGGAVQTGLRYADEQGYDVAIQVDGDGQHRPSETGKLLQYLESGECDMTIGSRYLENTGYQTPFLRRMGMIFFSVFTSLIIGQRIADTTSGFRAVNKRVIRYLSRHYPVDFPDAEALVMVHRQGFCLQEVPVKMNQRLSGKSSTTTLKSLYYPFKACLAILAILLQGREKE